MIRSIFITAVAASGLALIVGCESKGDKVSGVAPEARQAISAAATAHYPGNPTTSRDVQAAAINSFRPERLPLSAGVELHQDLMIGDLFSLGAQLGLYQGVPALGGGRQVLFMLTSGDAS